jgi:hypothetical protein
VADRSRVCLTEAEIADLMSPAPVACAPWLKPEEIAELMSPAPVVQEPWVRSLSIYTRRISGLCDSRRFG